MHNIWNKYKILVLTSLIVAAIALPWFFHSGYIFLVDFVWGPHIMLLWSDNWFLLNLAVRILAFIFPVALLQKLFVAAILFILLWSGRRLASQFVTEDPWLAFVVSLFGLFNPFVYDRLLYGQVGVVLSLAFFLATAAFLIEAYRTHQGKSLVFAGVFSALAIMFTPHFIFFLIPLFALFQILVLLNRKKFSFKKTFLYLLLTPIIIVVLNANWIYANLSVQSRAGALIQQGIQRQDLVAFQTSGKTGGEALRNVAIMSGFWGKDQFRYIDLTKIPNGYGLSFLFLLPLVMWGVYTAIRRRETRGLGIGLLILYMLAIFLAVGIRLPVAREITYWLFDHLPLYKGLRETQKWVSVEVIIYLIFLAIGAREFFRTKFIRENGMVFKLLLAAIIFMQAPLLLWGFRGQAKISQYPSDWYQANRFISQDSGCKNNTLVLPWHLYLHLNFAPGVVANPANQFFTCKTFQGTNMEFGGIYNNDPNPDSKIIEQWISQRGATDLLTANRLNIQYIILGKDVDWKNYLWLNSLPNLKLVQDTPTLKVYKLQ
jgi:hypothetical protein